MNRNNLLVFTPEGSHAANANAGDLPPGPVLPNEGDPLTTERLFIMLQDMSRSLNATQARLEQLTNQPPTLVAPVAPPPVALPANNLPPPPLAPPQDPIANWLRPDHNPVHQYHNPLYAPESLHGGYDPRDFGQYAESAAEHPKENEAINTLQEQVKALN